MLPPAYFTLVTHNKILKMKRTCDFFGKIIKEVDLVLYLPSLRAWAIYLLES